MSKLSKVTPFLGCAAVLVLAGCSVDPVKYETTPVKLSSPKGPVVCQLYTHRQVIWDEAISIPPGMTIAEGDQICKNEGLRRLKK
ncbi:hypothetical protein [uncultured Roseovarius sp.]|uniref:hypothetical protein n=1 Tax=uncultured Roseovarius sp. TaxID=293344 RepID=UPI00262EFE91|nr:hypothetical protein [uncultured Roseovarius sp.]